jgi:hypothetical protein
LTTATSASVAKGASATASKITARRWASETWFCFAILYFNTAAEASVAQLQVKKADKKSVPRERKRVCP